MAGDIGKDVEPAFKKLELSIQRGETLLDDLRNNDTEVSFACKQIIRMDVLSGTQSSLT